jgi:hypothetical protein
MKLFSDAKVVFLFGRIGLFFGKQGVTVDNLGFG